MNFEIHHFAYLTENIDSSVKEMTTFGFDLEGPIHNIYSQKVSICFLKNFDGVRLELVQPMEDNYSLKMMISNGITLYHAGYLVNSIEESAAYLLDKGFFQVNIFCSEAFNGNKCAFFVSRTKNLIELIEQ